MRPAAILDIGSSKIVCLCGSTAVRGGTVVHGAGVCAYAGYESGEFLDIKSLDEAIVSAIRDAEEMSRIRIRDIVVAVPAPFSKLIVTAATIRLDPRKERIKADDIDELISLSLAKARAPEHVLMHSTPIPTPWTAIPLRKHRRANARVSCLPRSRTCMCRSAF